jgi:hypothetical protein
MVYPSRALACQNSSKTPGREGRFRRVLYPSCWLPGCVPDSIIPSTRLDVASHATDTYDNSPARHRPGLLAAQEPCQVPELPPQLRPSGAVAKVGDSLLQTHYPEREGGRPVSGNALPARTRWTVLPGWGERAASHLTISDTAPHWPPKTNSVRGLRCLGARSRCLYTSGRMFGSAA